ncbi:MAG: Jag N-terminal domain-containing protein [Desulfomonile sp.]|nr:Jag N-terminal domain-containing protein [Desulfomonile sp.]
MFYEFTGKTVKEAVEKACGELGVDEALLDVEVVEESKSGFLGLVGQRDARIKVKKRDLLKEIMEVSDQPSEPEREPLPGPCWECGSEETSAAPQEAGVAETEESPAAQEAPPELEQARKILVEILAKMTIEAEVRPKMDNGAVYLEIIGDGSGLLIGKEGHTLNALQYLVSKIVNKDAPAHGKTEIIIDTENYRLRKIERLREKALKMSRRARKTLKPVWLEPMPPDERRIVHMVLASDREVYTKSHGEGAMRRIVVYPRRMPNKRRGR